MLQQRERFLDCPYCGEQISVLVDPSVSRQSYVEDCEVCCCPMSITCEVDEQTVSLKAERSDG
jgi:hypothetical protein